MTVPAYQEYATLADFLRLGLPPEALRAARTTQAPVTATGAGVGLVVPGGALDVGALYLSALEVLVGIVAGGAPGVATWAWSTNGGTTWSPTATTPAAGASAALVLPGTGVASGLTIRFQGAQTLGATYAWTARSCVADALEAANEEAYEAYGDRYGGLTTIPLNIVRDVCSLAVPDVAVVIGYRPDGQDGLFEQRAAAARKRMREAREHVTTPRADGPRTSPRPPFVTSRPRR